MRALVYLASAGLPFELKWHLTIRETPYPQRHSSPKFLASSQFSYTVAPQNTPIPNAKSPRLPWKRASNPLPKQNDIQAPRQADMFSYQVQSPGMYTYNNGHNLLVIRLLQLLAPPLSILF
ncbi:hypothetical protein FVER53590_25945 [Fusarium verticillioides]|nr:hypothetical protein FVER53590_25945 [Fusarium verticillioides]